MILPPLPEAPVDLIRPGDALVASDPGMTWGPVIGAGVGAVGLLAVCVILWRFRPLNLRFPLSVSAVVRRLTPAPDRRAFLDLARRLGLSRRHRSGITRLGRSARVPPVAIILSEHALDTALTRIDLRTNIDEHDEALIAEVRSIVFTGLSGTLR